MKVRTLGMSLTCLRPRPSGLLTLVGIVLLLTGCGALDGNLQVTYRDDGSVRAAIALEGTDVLGYELGQSDLAARLREQGWHIELTRVGALTTLDGWVERSSPAELLPALRAVARPDMVGLPGLFDHWRFRRQDGLFASEYTLVAQLPEDGLGGPDGLPAIMFMADERRRASADQNVRFRVTVELPGDLIETNADFHSGGIAAWRFTYSELDRGRVLLATSRQTHWGNIIVAALFTGATGLIVTGVLLRLLSAAPSPLSLLHEHAGRAAPSPQPAPVLGESEQDAGEPRPGERDGRDAPDAPDAAPEQGETARLGAGPG